MPRSGALVCFELPYTSACWKTGGVLATTALVSEILVVGLEAEAWLAILVLAVFGSDWVDLGGLKGWEALVTILVVAGAYVLGILIDRLADSALHWTRGRDQPGFANKRLVVLD